MKICAVAASSGVSMRMICYYERQGLIGPIKRSPAGNPIYSPRDIHILDFIKCLRGLGYPVAEIRDLLALWLDRSRAIPELKTAATRHVQELSLKAAALSQIADVFIELTDSFDRADRNDYPILKKSSDLSRSNANQSDQRDLRYIGRGH